LLSFVGGHDVVALLPTGFGKSLIFQLAPLVVKELAKANASNANPIVVVVSPLVALMEDQVKEILIIISDVLGDIDGDLQYDSERYLTDQDLYYSNYFDNVDDDVEDALMSRVSSSESEQNIW
jgi:ATP-dependent helicase YprA (DUF1998 family)